MNRNRLSVIIPLLLLCAALTACRSKPAPPVGKRYEFKGTVVSIDKANQSATISHEAVKDLMEGMTMPFKLKDAWPLDVMKPGDEVQATLVMTDESAWLEDVVVVQKSPAQTGGTATPENSASPKEGDAVPDFRLVNQDGKTVRLKAYQGKALLLTFIYTRCPVPEYCSLMSSNFASVERELKKDAALYNKTHLLSISFDPAYDTPKVLRSYGAAQTGNYDKETFNHWEFVTGDAEEIKRLAQFFGLTYLPDKDQFVHSLQTALIAPDGKVSRLYSGNEWKPEDVTTGIRALFEKT
ncbi:MAG TPA: SCO family protein, partial [Pyrinomonadaceae bacterium]|nr:SCO family protein [Pyrinomonadaceae bacterium]